MNELKKYFKSTLGIEPKIGILKAEKLKALPLFITNGYTIYSIELFERDFLLIDVKYDFTTNRLKKHLDIIRKTFNKNIIAVIPQLEAYIRARLIEQKIPFIIPGRQMYLPDLLIDLKEFGNKPKNIPKTLQPAAQLLLLYHLQVETLEGINLKGIAKKLNYNAGTITRAVHYLQNIGLCTLEGTKDKLLHFNKANKELWAKAEPLMQNPIKKSIYYNGVIEDNNIFKANNNALAHYTNLNDDIIEYYAVKPNYIKLIEGDKLKETAIHEGNICIEEWKYDPNILTNDDFVDPLSLYLCFRNETDERIEMALEQIIEQLAW